MRLVKVALLIISFLIVEIGHAEGPSQFAKCAQLEESKLAEALHQICERSLIENESAIDVTRVVSIKWVETGMDDVINREVDSAIKKVNEELGFLDKLKSAWSGEKSKEVAEKVATYAFKSEKFLNSCNNLSEKAGEEVTQKIIAISQYASFDAITCIKDFISEQYSKTIFDAFEHQMKKEIEKVDPSKEVTTPSMLKTHGLAMGGGGVVVAGYIAKKVTEKISQELSKRIAGKISTRILGRIAGRTVVGAIPIVGWIVGGGMIAWDLIKGGTEGVLPQIATELKSFQVKEKIKGEIAKAIVEGLKHEYPHIAKEITSTLYGKWVDFRGRYEQMLNLAKEHPELKRVLDSTDMGKLDKLSNLVGIITRDLGKDRLVEAAANGNLSKVMALPESSFRIIQTTKSLESILAWAQIAPDKLIERVVEFDIYKMKKPEDFDSLSLKKLVEVNDKNIIAKVCSLEKTPMLTLLTLLSEFHLKALVSSSQNDLDQLRCVAWYLSEAQIGEEGKDRMLKILTEKKPYYINRLCSNTVRKSIQEVNISERPKIIAFVLSEKGPIRFIGDLKETIFGESITFALFFDKYGNFAKVLFGFLGILLLILLVKILVPLVHRTIKSGEKEVKVNANNT